MTPVLELTGVTKRFGNLVAVDDVDLSVAPGRVHGIIGPNGAGKTTLFNIMTGYQAADEGRIRFDGRDITRLPAYRRASIGLVRTFQNIRLFGRLTVTQNVLLGQHRFARTGIGSIWPVPTAQERRLRGQVDELLDTFGLTEVRNRRAGDLPYGAQKRLEMARAMAAQPRVLLLDEPTAGMNESESAAITEQLRAIRERDVTVLLVEHDMSVVMAVSDTVTVLNFGRKIAEGDPEAVQGNEEVQVAYLGT